MTSSDPTEGRARMAGTAARAQRRVEKILIVRIGCEGCYFYLYRRKENECDSTSEYVDG